MRQNAHRVIGQEETATRAMRRNGGKTVVKQWGFLLEYPGVMWTEGYVLRHGKVLLRPRACLSGTLLQARVSSYLQTRELSST